VKIKRGIRVVGFGQKEKDLEGKEKNKWRVRVPPSTL
jgi:hypothetical protein